ncbi:unnamed protein product [Soboliphyme baturini]|uniref:Peptidase S1 domain-containing protein n=1 Tax=Soboliphyme baturini TaxID=241478 RepID=A0A183IKA6_9BILA|nr:unnamed protein product [Soboliphyme baturini]
MSILKVTCLLALVSLGLGQVNKQISPLSSNGVPDERFSYRKSVFKMFLNLRASGTITTSFRKSVATLFHATSDFAFLVSSGREFFVSSLRMIRPTSVSILLKSNSSATISVNPVSVLVHRSASTSPHFDIAVLKVSLSGLDSVVFRSPVSIATVAEEASIAFSCETLIQKGQPLFCPLSHVERSRKQTTVLAGIFSVHNCEVKSRLINLYMKTAPHTDWLNNAITILDIVKPGTYSITEDQRLFDAGNIERPLPCQWPSDYSGEREETPRDASLLSVLSNDQVRVGVYVKNYVRDPFNFDIAVGKIHFAGETLPRMLPACLPFSEYNPAATGLRFYGKKQCWYGDFGTNRGTSKTLHIRDFKRIRCSCNSTATTVCVLRSDSDVETAPNESPLLTISSYLGVRRSKLTLVGLQRMNNTGDVRCSQESQMQPTLRVFTDVSAFRGWFETAIDFLKQNTVDGLYYR